MRLDGIRWRQAVRPPPIIALFLSVPPAELPSAVAISSICHPLVATSKRSPPSYIVRNVLFLHQVHTLAAASLENL